MKHAHDLMEAYGEAEDGRDWTYILRDRPVGLQGYEEWIQSSIATYKDWIYIAIINKENAKAVGVSCVRRIDLENGVLEIGSINFSRAMQRNRMGTEAIYLILKVKKKELFA